MSELIPIISASFLFSGSPICSVAGASAALHPKSYNMTCQLVALTGVTSAVCTFQGSNDGVNWVTLGTVTLSGPGSDGFAVNAAWRDIQANVTSLVGGNCQATLAAWGTPPGPGPTLS